MQDVLAGLLICGGFCWFVWLIFSTIRRVLIARMQSNLQTRLLEKIQSGQELLAYAQTDTGRQLLESLKVERVAGKAPQGRIILALQAGIIFILFGSAMLWLRTHVPSISVDGTQACTIFGTLFLALGFGFALSSAASYYLSKSFGLLNGTRA